MDAFCSYGRVVKYISITWIIVLCFYFRCLICCQAHMHLSVFIPQSLAKSNRPNLPSFDWISNDTAIVTAISEQEPANQAPTRPSQLERTTRARHKSPLLLLDGRRSARLVVRSAWHSLGRIPPRLHQPGKRRRKSYPWDYYMSMKEIYTSSSRVVDSH